MDDHRNVQMTGDSSNAGVDVAAADAAVVGAVTATVVVAVSVAAGAGADVDAAERIVSAASSHGGNAVAHYYQNWDCYC